MQRLGKRPVMASAAAMALAPAVALADNGEAWGYGHMGWGGWIFGPLMMILFIGLVVGAIIVVVRLFDGPRAGGGRRALDLLDERFARGEIDKAEYEERRAALSR